MEKMFQKSLWQSVVVVVMFLIAGTVSGQESPKIGIRGGAGTDVNLGVAYGIGVNYLISFPKNSLELGVQFFGGSYKETSDNGYDKSDNAYNKYKEKTDLTVIGVMANYLIGYKPREPSFFFVTGIGLASIDIEWEEKSDTDDTLGELMPGGGSKQSEGGSAVGTVLDLGIGRSFSKGFDIRAEVPIIVTSSAPGEASSVIPTFIVTLGYRF
jgi:hypothetical protein